MIGDFPRLELDSIRDKSRATEPSSRHHSLPIHPSRWKVRSNSFCRKPPFLDGNGRIGRLLVTFLLTERGILGKPVLYLSHYFKKHRQEYYVRMQEVRDSLARRLSPRSNYIIIFIS